MACNYSLAFRCKYMHIRFLKPNFDLLFFKCSSELYIAPLKIRGLIPVHHTYSTNASSDVLYIFTEKLMNDKTKKWNSINIQNNVDQNPNKNLALNASSSQIDYDKQNISLTVSNCNIDNVRSLIMGALNCNQFNVIMSSLQYCIKMKQCLPAEDLEELASVFARRGKKCGIEVVATLSKYHYEKEYLNKAEYKHYFAEAAWINGNIQEAITLFSEVYENNVMLRSKLRTMIKFFIRDVVSFKGEAALVLVTNFVRSLSLKHEDFYMLAMLWQFCFLSECFADQTLAMELLKENEKLKNFVKNRISSITIAALKSHQSETIYRLLEVLLHFEMQPQYSQVLRAFFDYKCALQDINSCSNILKCALELNIPLTAQQHQKFLALLLHRPLMLTIFSDSRHGHRKWSKGKAPMFQMKF